MKKILKVIYRIFYTLLKFKSGIKFNSESAEYIVWAPHFFTLRFMHGDNFPKTIAIYKTLLENNKKCSIYTWKDIGKFYNKKIFIIGSPMYNIYGFEDYVDILFHIVERLESQQNEIFPNLKQIKYWENKIFMHQKFEELNIRTPKSRIISNLNDIKELNLTYPFLLKEPHSCSANGVHKISDEKSLNNFISNNKLTSQLIFQGLLNIKKDLRVILVGGEIVLHYWRINLADEWKPTSTGHGSKVDFVSFPEKWRDYIIEIFKKLDLDTGAFDIAWENDDIDTEPYVLEVSPFYQPNPIPNFNLDKISYGEWKKSFTFSNKNNYNKAMIDILFDIQRKYVNWILSEKK